MFDKCVKKITFSKKKPVTFYSAFRKFSRSLQVIHESDGEIMHISKSTVEKYSLQGMGQNIVCAVFRNMVCDTIIVSETLYYNTWT